MQMLSHVVMADEPDLIRKLLNTLSPLNGKIELGDVRGYVSSPKLAEIHVRGQHGAGLVAVGDTYLDARTMLADRAQKTYAVSILELDQFLDGKEVINEPGFRDVNATRIEVWSFDPSTLPPDQLTLAVALSYTTREFIQNERAAGAVNELIEPLGFIIPDREY
ncbi:hypothetical protein N5C93_23370 [Pseudomonas nitroreducens]|nr:hypothetical protein [Pseudomonas nitroreducens]MDG9856960.1 hypothetical protein [Pseudomonas nitroreducens]MDH1075782.1 hypothetical protein [Pseudomonas nitroreducens]NMZ76672.1 hypothetical protein [Pseudomonas nitroreducens]